MAEELKDKEEILDSEERAQERDDTTVGVELAAADQVAVKIVKA